LELGLVKIFATSSTDAHTVPAARARCTGVRCSFFAARQRTNQENAPKAAAFGNCFRAALQSGLGRKTYIFQVQLSPLCHHERQAENARFVEAILTLWSGWDRDPPLAGAILWNSARSSPYRVRRSCSGYTLFLPIKFLKGGTGGKLLERSFPPRFPLNYSPPT